VKPEFKAQEAHIYAHLFENPEMAVPRGVYWSCTIHFGPQREQGADADDESWPCSLMVDWICWQVRDWRELDGKSLEDSSDARPFEASLYFHSQHQPVDDIDLQLEYLGKDRFRIRGRFTADLVDLNGKELSGAFGSFDVEAHFEGVSVVMENIVPKPLTAVLAASALQPFIDAERFREPQLMPQHWLFAPDTGE
jgi:hypothetical protein